MGPRPRSPATRSPRTIVLAGVLTAVCIGYIGPVNGYIAQRSELARERADLTQLQARRDALSTQLKALERADVLEARARQLGMLKPGEKGYVLKRSQLEPPPPAPERDDDGLWGWLTSRF